MRNSENCTGNRPYIPPQKEKTQIVWTQQQLPPGEPKLPILSGSCITCIIYAASRILSHWRSSHRWQWVWRVVKLATVRRARLEESKFLKDKLRLSWAGIMVWCNSLCNMGRQRLQPKLNGKFAARAGLIDKELSMGDDAIWHRKSKRRIPCREVFPIYTTATRYIRARIVNHMIGRVMFGYDMGRVMSGWCADWYVILL